MLDYFKNMMADDKGNASSKRWVAVICSFVLCGALISSIVLNTKADPEIVHAMMYIIIAGLGITGIEKFASK